MASSAYVYPIHRAINRPLSLYGFKGRYILLAGAGLVGDLLLFVILYCCKLPSVLCILIVLGLGAIILTACARLSQRYGHYGLLKKRSRQRVPPDFRCRSRKLFTNLKR
jgi:hypothetical protein